MRQLSNLPPGVTDRMIEDQISDEDLEHQLGIQTPSTHQLNDLEMLVGRAVSLMDQLNSLEELSKGVKAEIQNLVTKLIPDAMASAGVSDFKTVSGVKVTVRDFINGSLPKDPEARNVALGWLSKNGAADIIKDYVSLEFSKGQHNFAADVKATLEEKGATFTSKEDVHPSTLAAYARERLRNGEPCPMELLGLFSGRKAKVELP